MPLIYLEGGYFHHDMMEVEDLREVWYFAKRPRLDISFNPEAPPRHEPIRKYGYRRCRDGCSKPGWNVYHYGEEV